MKPEEVMERLKKCRQTTAAEKIAVDLEGTCHPGVNQNNRVKALKKQLTDDEKDFFEYMTGALPPIIGRAEVDRFLPGLLKSQTLAQADSAGLGPEVAWRVGRKIAYRTDSLILWLIGRFGIQKMVEINKFLNLS